MQDVTLPYWFIWVGSTFGAGLIAWAVYQNRITQENKEAIIRIGTNYEHMAKDISDIKEEITQLGERLDKFLASELQFLKSKLNG
jgi:hypothetical protein